MRTLWNIVSFLAVVHLLALVMFVGWLWKTQRLDGARIGEMRQMLATTIPEAEQAATEAAAEAARLEQERAEAGIRDNPGVPSSDRVRSITDAHLAEQRSVRRISDVKDELARQLAQTQSRIEEQRDALAQDRATVEGGIAGDRERRAAEQLAKAAKLLEALPPKQAKNEIIELVNGGKTDTAVLYLDTMNQRLAAKVLAEFKTDQEVKLATELLERIRTLGDPEGSASAATDSSDADRTPDSP